MTTRDGRQTIRARATSVLSVAGLGLGLLLGGCAISSRGADLESRITAARTPHDHAEIARAFLRETNKREAEALYHRRVAGLYQHYVEPPAEYPIYPGRRRYDASYLEMTKHCQALADDLERAAGELRELARLHEELAGLPQVDTKGSGPMNTGSTPSRRGVAIERGVFARPLLSSAAFRGVCWRHDATFRLGSLALSHRPIGLAKERFGDDALVLCVRHSAEQPLVYQ